MTDHETDDRPLPPSALPLPTFLDLAFWPALVLAGGLFALAALSPGAAEWRDVRQRLAVADARAAALRAEVDGLSRVSAALRTDPAFAAEVARLDLGLLREGADRLAVPAAPPPVALAPPPAAPAARWPLIDAVAEDRRLRTGLAVAAAVLASLAFTLCQPAAAGLVRRAFWLPRVAGGAVWNRYRSP